MVFVQGNTDEIADAADEAPATEIGSNALCRWMYQRVGGAFGHLDEKELHGCKVRSEREAAGKDLQYYGYTGFDTSSTKQVDERVPLTKSMIERTLMDPVISSDEVIREFMKRNLEAALDVLPGSTLKKEYIDFIDARGRDVPQKSPGDFRQKMRSYVLMLGIHVVEEIPDYTPHIKQTKEEVRDMIRKLGTAYVGISDSFFDLGIDGDFLSKNEVTDSDLKQEFGLESAFRRKVVLNLLEQHKPQPVKLVNIGYLCTHLTFDWNSQAPNGPAPSAEYVRARANVMLAYESSRQLLGMDIEIEAAIEQVRI